MIGSQTFPFIDGLAPSWADLTVSMSPPRPPGAIGGALSAASQAASAVGINPLVLSQIQAINTGTSLEIDNVRAGGRVIARTTGEETCTASMAFYTGGFQEFLTRISTLAPLRGLQRRAGLVHFDLDYQYRLPNNPVLYGCRIKGCRFAGREKNSTTGNAADIVTVALSVIQVVDVVNGQEVCLI